MREAESCGDNVGFFSPSRFKLLPFLRVQKHQQDAVDFFSVSVWILLRCGKNATSPRPPA